MITSRDMRGGRTLWALMICNIVSDILIFHYLWSFSNYYLFTSWKVTRKDISRALDTLNINTFWFYWNWFMRKFLSTSYANLDGGGGSPVLPSLSELLVLTQSDRWPFLFNVFICIDKWHKFKKGLMISPLILQVYLQRICS